MTEMNPAISRRDLLKRAALLPIGVALGQAQSLRGAEVGFSSEVRRNARIKLSVNAWSYYVPLYRHLKGESGGMSLFDMLEECARLEVDAVDPTGYFFPGYPNVPDSKFVSTLKRRAFQLGLEFSGTGIRNDFATTDKVKRAADVELAKQWIEVAAEMGAPVLRVFAGPQPQGESWDDTAGWMADALEQCAQHGQQYGVMVGVQNHGDMLKSAGEVLKLLSMVKSDWLGTIVDTGFFLTPDPYDDIAKVIPHAVNWQVKEQLSNRQGPKIDMNKLVQIISKSDYRGYVPIETLPVEGKEDQYDAMARVPELVNSLRNALNDNADHHHN